MQKKIIFIVEKKFKNTESAQLWHWILSTLHARILHLESGLISTCTGGLVNNILSCHDKSKSSSDDKSKYDKNIITAAGDKTRVEKSKPRGSWALLVFLNLFNNKKWFVCIFYQAFIFIFVIYMHSYLFNLFLHQSCLKSPLPVKLTW